LKPPSPKRISFSWDEGVYLDAWTVVHLLTGVAFAAGFLIFSKSLLLGLAIITLLTVVYEIGEYIFGILEHIHNSAVDVIVALAGYAIYVQIFFAHSPDVHWKSLAFVSAINLFLAYLGHRAYRRRMKKQ